MKPNQLKSLHTSVLNVFTAYTSATKAEGADHAAMVKLLRAAPLNDAEAVKAIRDDMLTTFGEPHKDAAQIRINIVNNARRVAFGGMKDGKAIRGKGMSAMLEVADSVASIRELKKALADAVPESLKSERGGDRKSAKKTGAEDKRSPLSIPKVATREKAFEAARKILEFVRDKFTKPSDTELIPAINRTMELLSK